MLFREVMFYIKAALVGLVVFCVCYGYLKWLGIPGELNKAAADTGIILMGFSMLQSSLSYYFNFMDHAMIYRKYFGLTGFAFAVTHIIQSWSAFTSLFSLESWTAGIPWPFFTGLSALLIFTSMAVISNTALSTMMGTANWRRALRVGYLGVVFVLSHVVLLKSSRWITWFEGGMKTPPSLSLLVSVFMVIVVVMRLMLWWSLKHRKPVLHPQELAATPSPNLPTAVPAEIKSRVATAQPVTIPVSSPQPVVPEQRTPT